MKRIIPLSLCLLLIVGLIGTNVLAAENDPLVLTMFSGDINPDDTGFEDPIAKKITEATGVKLKMEYPVGEYEQKVTLMIASGEYPDLIFHKNAGPFVEAGAFIDLTPYIEEYGENIKDLYGPYLNRLRYSIDDPSIYFLGSFGVGSKTWDVSGVQLQHAVAKELGYPKMETVQDLEEALKAYIEKYPTINGQPTIGLSLLADDWRFLITVTNQAVFATGGPDDGEWYIDPETYEAVLHHTRPEEREYFRWLNHMNDIGLLDPESFIQKYDQYLAKIASGRVLALTDARWQYEQAEQALRQAGMFERTYGSYPIVLNENFRRADLQDPGYSAGWGIGITVDCKDPVAAFKFLDWMASDEAQILNNWGIEGVNYEVIDGKRVIPPEEMNRRLNDPTYRKTTGVGLYVYPFPQRGDGLLDPTGNTYTITTPDYIKDRYSDVEREVLSAYGVEMWMELFPQQEELPIKTWGAAWQIPTPEDPKYQMAWQRIQDIIKRRIPEAILASPEQFDAIYDKMLAEIDDAGLAYVEEKFNELLQNRLKHWGIVE
ncbi:MAG: extracellular solute-binding protein [Firmicutes bacterium]|nr:extracellular solute-binding protein [Bacillota bacterium]